MSFLDLFKQPIKVKKPYSCLSCKARFLLKAHAANHQRQASSRYCRDRGFAHTGDNEHSQIPERKIPLDDVKVFELDEYNEI